jgi:hypothetical protein
VLKTTPVVLLFGPSLSPASGESRFPTQSALQFKHLSEFAICKLKITRGLIGPPWHQSAVDSIGDIWVGVVVLHPLAKSAHWFRPQIRQAGLASAVWRCLRAPVAGTAFNRFVASLWFTVSTALVAPSVSVSGIDLQSAVQALDRLLASLQVGQRRSLVVPGASKFGIDLQRAVQARDRLLVALWAT